MMRGRLYGDRYPLKWLNHDQRLVLGVFAFNGDAIGGSPFMTRPHAAGYRCLACKKIVIDEADSG
jgi:hypothetical protein